MAGATLTPTPTSRLVAGLLAVPPLWSAAKWQARRMMIGRAERLGIPWRDTVQTLEQRNWEADWAAVQDPDLRYPANYSASFHGYDAGHLCWQAAFEFEVASNAVHSSLYPEAGAHSDRALRDGYHRVLEARVPRSPAEILDLHCTVGLSSERLVAGFPGSVVTGLDFSPHYLAVARSRAAESGVAGASELVHALPEATGLASGRFGLISAFLLFHEMAADTTRRIFRECRRLLAPGGCLALMDMNPASGAYQTMPAALMTLLKSTEPFMDQFLALDLEQELIEAGFTRVHSESCSPRHRAVLAWREA
ncbi:class I SAM-dependent methyltransferase [Synechococcus sp. RSCCF101]|uniref:class I SAM-dependent methyltransferase n=1 Tax=Synechococcus sp. RSCCF101 TaxID=2511069 RepID=UPI001245211A|nr:class I SAM-dependent methyltransferase [Synechococcus sp. RSCCF101]QEY31090.1 class I SAM-dependent methyltransferase [Synechococcus sp. RSCCF101]